MGNGDEVDLSLVEVLQVPGDSAAYDASCKRVLSDRMILAHILKACIEEYGSCPAREVAWDLIEGEPGLRATPVHRTIDATPKIRGLRGEDTSPGEGTVYYDLLFRALLPLADNLTELAETGPDSVLVDVEAQLDFHPGYPLFERAQYYCARMLSAQYGTEFMGSRYELLRKVYSIWICMRPPKGLSGSVVRWPASYAPHVMSGDASLSRDWGRGLACVVVVCVGAPGSEGIAGLLGTLFSAQLGAEQKVELLEDVYHISATDALKEGVASMEMGVFAKAAILEGLEEGYERGMRRGMEEGVERGLEQGLEQGRSDAMAQCVRSLMSSMGMTLDEAFDALAMDDALRGRCRELLGA